MRFFVIMLFSSCWWGVAQAQPVQKMLSNMVHAVDELNYDANLVLQKGSDMESIHVMHIHQQDKILERISYETGEVRTIVRTGDEVSFTLPDTDSDSRSYLTSRNPLLAISPKDIEQLTQNYEVKHEGQARAAGQACDKIYIQPKAPDRYSHRVCIDTKTGLVLNIASYNSDDIKIDGLMVTRITYDPAIDAKLFNHNEHPYQLKPMPAESSQDERSLISQWKINWLPKGFVLQSMMQKHSEHFQVPVDYLMYHDGLVSISIYFESIGNQDTSKPHYYQQGKTTLYQYNKLGYQMTLVGELPPATLVRIAESIDNPKLRQAIEQIESQ